MAVCVRDKEEWTPPFTQKIRCEKPGESGGSDDSDDTGSSCGPLSIKTDKNTVQDCSGDVCNFSCKNDATPTVDKIACKNGKWNIPKAAKKKGIKCAAEEAAACRHGFYFFTKSTLWYQWPAWLIQELETRPKSKKWPIDLWNNVNFTYVQSLRPQLPNFRWALHWNSADLPLWAQIEKMGRDTETSFCTSQFDILFNILVTSTLKLYDF